MRELIEVSSYRPGSGLSLEMLELIEGGADRSAALAAWVSGGRSEGSFYKALKGLKDDLVVWSYLEKRGLDDLQRRRMEVWEKFRFVKMSFVAKRRAAAVALAIEVVQLAQRLGMTDVVASLAGDLEHHFGLIDPDTRRYLRYRKLRKDFSRILADENDAKALQVQMVFSVNRGKDLSLLEGDVRELEGKVGGSVKFMQFRFGALSVWYDEVGDVSGMLRCLRETAAFYDTCGQPVPANAKSNLYFRSVRLLLAEGRFGEAEALVWRGLEGVAPGTHNWHAFLLQLAEIGFASGKPGISASALKMSENAPCEYSSAEIDEEWEKVRERLVFTGC